MKWLLRGLFSIKTYVGVLALTVFLAVPVSQAVEPAIGQNYKAEEKMVVGMIVGTVPDKTETVQPSNINLKENMIGVVTKKPLVSLGEEEKDKIEVVTSGVTNVLVSDINGLVEAGDKITASQIDGVGMKNVDPGMILGTAQTGLDDIETKKKTVEIDGMSQEVNIGQMPVEVGVIFHTAEDVEKPLTPAQIFAAVLVLVLGVVAVIVMILYASGRYSTVAIAAMLAGIVLIVFITIYLILEI